MFTKSLISIALFVTLVSNQAQAGETIFSDSANVKMARLKGKARILKNTRQEDIITNEGQESLKSVSDCGSIKIADNSGKKKIGAAPKKIEVLIIGDIINTGNNC